MNRKIKLAILACMSLYVTRLIMPDLCPFGKTGLSSVYEKEDDFEKKTRSNQEVNLLGNCLRTRPICTIFSQRMCFLFLRLKQTRSRST